ncbi:unnamed protein product [Miscanthus lutarioriparius]|uniref:C6H2-type domain-containing protein n=1 Tax=Miscanthus lutarioriparius TaxID=422564 RepID=A0A811S0W2_9POAL|nr:unnamed protein product [Miscanthus lutarioriparius]
MGLFSAVLRALPARVQQSTDPPDPIGVVQAAGMEKGAPEASPPCARCGKPAQLQCPKCAELKLPRENATFCTLDCFRVAWSSHKSVHPKPGALASQQSPEGWKYYVRKGRGRALELPRFDWTGPLRPYPISKMRVVPDEIEKPDWALDIKTPELIERMRETCRIAREVLDAAARVIKLGITTDEIDRVVHEETIARGGYPSPLNYHFFPRSCCTSVNEVICHGIPDARL